MPPVKTLPATSVEPNTIRPIGGDAPLASKKIKSGTRPPARNLDAPLLGRLSLDKFPLSDRMRIKFIINNASTEEAPLKKAIDECDKNSEIAKENIAITNSGLEDLNQDREDEEAILEKEIFKFFHAKEDKKESIANKIKNINKNLLIINNTINNYNENLNNEQTRFLDLGIQKIELQHELEKIRETLVREIETIRRRGQAIRVKR